MFKMFNELKKIMKQPKTTKLFESRNEKTKGINDSVFGKWN